MTCFRRTSPELLQAIVAWGASGDRRLSRVTRSVRFKETCLQNARFEIVYPNPEFILAPALDRCSGAGAWSLFTRRRPYCPTHLFIFKDWELLWSIDTCKTYFFHFSWNYVSFWKEKIGVHIICGSWISIKLRILNMLRAPAPDFTHAIQSECQILIQIRIQNMAARLTYNNKLDKCVNYRDLGGQIKNWGVQKILIMIKSLHVSKKLK